MKVSFVNKLSEKKETLVIVSDRSSMPKIAGVESGEKIPLLIKKAKSARFLE